MIAGQEDAARMRENPPIPAPCQQCANTRSREHPVWVVSMSESEAAGNSTGENPNIGLRRKISAINDPEGRAGRTGRGQNGRRQVGASRTPVPATANATNGICLGKPSTELPGVPPLRKAKTAHPTPSQRAWPQALHRNAALPSLKRAWQLLGRPGPTTPKQAI